MKPATCYSKHRVKFTLATCLVALVSLSVAPLWAQTVADPDLTIKDEEVTTLSPFTVTSDKDFGYLKTNAATATRVGAEIQKVPFTISVISEEFMQDVDLQSTTDIYKYLASASGDNQYQSDRPSNNPTPQGNNRIRGFPVNIILRNGVFLYSAQNIADTVDRIEVIKGPAAVFFGQGYPGGVINYVTKKAEFAKLPTTLKYTTGQNNVNHAVLDTNQMLSDKAALRIVGGWNNSKGDASFEYIKRFNLDASLVLRPLGNDKLRLTYEISHLDEMVNDSGKFAWIFPQGWFDSYANPTAAEIASSGLADAAAYKNSIDKSLGNWIKYKRNELGNQNYPLYTSVQRGAFYMDASGKRIQDEAFNFNNRGSFNQNMANIKEFTIESHPTDWMDFRYVYTHDKTHFDDREGYWYPYANGRQFWIAGPNGAGYYRDTALHQVDVVLKYDTDWITPMKHKLLAGILNNKYLQQYYAVASGTQYFYIPGFNSYGTNGNSVIPGISGSVPTGQQLFDRYGVAKTAAQVYTEWDPGFEIQPPVDKITSVNRNQLDGYWNQDNAWYVNYQGTALDDRLTIMGGWRHETYRQAGQALTANFPWFSPPVYAGNDTVTYPPSMYDYSPGYSLTNFLTQKGDSWMAGVSFELKKDVNIYATVSKTFHYNGTGSLATWVPYIPEGLTSLYTQTLAAYQSVGVPMVYQYPDGSTRTITSVAEAAKAVEDAGAFNITKNETGKNIEVGVKTSLYDGKITSTVSFYQADRVDQRKEDGYHQSLDIFNFNYNPIIDPATGNNVSPYPGRRSFRWYGNSAHDRTRGVDGEIIWTPVRNFQSYIAFGWMFTAKTVSDPSVGPADLRVGAGYFSERLESSPEYTFKTYNKYTFTDGPVRGLSIGLGMRYASAAIIGRNNSWTPNQGGLAGADYTVFDLSIAYPYEIYGYKLKSQLGIYNATDETYSDGWYSLAPSRYINLTTTLTF
jgi:outer membrane receptor protein involved in Fe transport